VRFVTEAFSAVVHVGIQFVEEHVLGGGRREGGLAFVVFRTGGNGKGGGVGGFGEELAGGGAGGEVEAELSFVGLGLAGRGVVHLHGDFGAATEEFAGVLGEKSLINAGNVAGEKAVETGEAGGDQGEQLLELGAFEDEGVVDDATVAGLHVDGAEPFVLGGGVREFGVVVGQRAGGAQFLFRQRENEIGRAKRPISAGRRGRDG
jgi:hypothetical protein